MAAGASVDDYGWSELGSPAAVLNFDVESGKGNPLSTLLGQTRDGDFPPIYSPRNPLFWLLGFGLVATGAITVSTAAKFGPISVKAKA